MTTRPFLLDAVPTHVVVVCDLFLVADCIAALLERDPTIVVDAMTETIQDGIGLARDYSSDVIVVDCPQEIGLRDSLLSALACVSDFAVVLLADRSTVEMLQLTNTPVDLLVVLLDNPDELAIEVRRARRAQVRQHPRLKVDRQH